MDWGLGRNVVKGQDVIVFVNLGAGDLAAQNLGEDVLLIIGHRGILSVTPGGDLRAGESKPIGR
jgi:hypothetical protein